MGGDVEWKDWQNWKLQKVRNVENAKNARMESGKCENGKWKMESGKCENVYGLATKNFYGLKLFTHRPYHSLYFDHTSIT